MTASIDLDERRRRAKEAVQEARGAGVELVTLAERPGSPAASGGQPVAAAAVAPRADPPAAPTRPAVQAAAAPTAHAARAEPSPAPQVPTPAPVGYVPRRASFYQEGKGAERLAPSGADLVPLTVMVPNYLLRQIEQALAMNQGISKRFVVTDALSRAGFMVKPEDLVEDGRRKRRRT